MARGWWKLPEALAERSDLTSTAKMLYACLGDLARRGVRRGIGSRCLARRLGTAEKTVIRALRDLEGAGLVRITRRGRGRSPVYRLLGPLSETTPILGVVTTPILGVESTPQTAVAPTVRTGVVTTPIRGVGSSSSDTESTERTEGGLFPLTVAFCREVKRRFGRPLTEREAWKVNPGFREGCPVALALCLAERFGLGDPPWAWAERFLEGWREARAALAQCRAYHLGKVEVLTTGGALARVAQWVGPELKAWAKGESEWPGPGAAPEAPEGGGP